MTSTSSGYLVKRRLQTLPQGATHREKNFGEISRNSLLSTRGEIGPFGFENLGPFKTDPVPIDTAAQAHSTANPNSPKYVIGSLGFHFSFSSFTLAAAAWSVRPRRVSASAPAGCPSPAPVGLNRVEESTHVVCGKARNRGRGNASSLRDSDAWQGEAEGGSRRHSDSVRRRRSRCHHRFLLLQGMPSRDNVVQNFRSPKQ